MHQDRLRSLIVGGASPRSPKRYEQEEVTSSARILRERGVWALFEPSYRTSPNTAAIRAAMEQMDAQALAADREGLLLWDGMDPATVRVPTSLISVLVGPPIDKNG